MILYQAELKENLIFFSRCFAFRSQDLFYVVEFIVCLLQIIMINKVIT